ncbi:ATP-binding protein [Actinomadura geliboluensis]
MRELGIQPRSNQRLGLVMSEIVTNAVTAARGREIRLRCALEDGTPLLECWDPSLDLPAPAPPSLTAENGRGLAIVSAYE